MAGNFFNEAPTGESGQCRVPPPPPHPVLTSNLALVWAPYNETVAKTRAGLMTSVVTAPGSVKKVQLTVVPLRDP